MHSKFSGKIILILIGVLLLAISLFVIYSERNILEENPFETERVFAGYSSTATSADGAMLIIDRGKTRVTVLTNQHVSATISGGKVEGGFFYAEHIAADGEKIYIAEVNFDEGSTSVASERIMQFSMHGRFEKTIYECVYFDDKPLQYGNILDMCVNNGILNFVKRNGDDLELYAFFEGIATLTRVVSTENVQYLNTVHYDAFSDKVYTTSKDGLIYAEDWQGGLTMICDMSKSDSVPWDIAADSAGNVYFTNLTKRSIENIDGTVFFESENVIYEINISEDDIISSVDKQNAYQIDIEEGLLFSGDTASYSKGYFIWRLVLWILTIASGAAILFIIIRSVIWMIENSYGTQSKYFNIIVISSILTSAIVAISIFTDTLDAGSEENEYFLTQIAISMSKLSPLTIGDHLESIKTPIDYGEYAFQKIHGILDPICAEASKQGDYLYYVLYKNIDGTLCAIADYEDTVGVIYPIGDCPEKYIDLLEGRIPYLFEYGSDAYGSWTFALAPVYNSEGIAVGLIEMGLNKDIRNLRDQRQILDMVLSAFVLLVLVFMILVEILVIIEALYTQRKSSADHDHHIPDFIRPLTFIAFFAANISTAFLPQLSTQVFMASGFAFQPTMGAALPLSIQLFFVAIASFAGGMLIDRFGMKPVLIGGLLIEITGLSVTAAAAATESYVLLLAGVSVLGCGLGAVVVSGNTLPTYCKDEEHSNRMSSNVNVGLISGIVVGSTVGSVIANNAGYVATFIFSAIILCPALWLGYKCSPQKSRSDAKISKAGARSVSNDAAKVRQPGLSFLGFLRKRSVYAFALFLMFPFLVLSYFKDFLFPLYSSELGYSEDVIGRVLLFSGAIGIFAGPRLTEILLKRLHAKRTVILASALCVAGFLLFAIIPTIQTAIITVCIISVAGCFGLVGQSIYFSSINASKTFGVSKSMGFYSLYDSLSQTAGPLLFGAVMVFGYSVSGWIMGIATVVLLGIFALVGESDHIIKAHGEIEK